MLKALLEIVSRPRRQCMALQKIIKAYIELSLCLEDETLYVTWKAVQTRTRVSVVWVRAAWLFFFFFLKRFEFHRGDKNIRNYSSPTSKFMYWLNLQEVLCWTNAQAQVLLRSSIFTQAHDERIWHVRYYGGNTISCFAHNYRVRHNFKGNAKRTHWCMGWPK